MAILSVAAGYLCCMGASLTAIFYRARVDIMHQEDKFSMVLHQGDTPTLRFYTYVDGEKFQPDTNWVGVLGRGTNDEFTTSGEMISITGSANAATNFFEFAPAAAAPFMATNGRYFAQFMVTNNSTQKRMVFGDGWIEFLRSPIKDK